MRSPGVFTNSETGEARDADPYADVADHIQPAPTTEQPEPAAEEIQPGSPHAFKLTLDAYRDQIARDPLHPARPENASHPQHEAAYQLILDLTMAERGVDSADPEQNRALLEVHAGGRSRLPGAEALAPAPRPVLPEGHAWDEGALVLGETEAHACGLAPHVVMQATADIAEVIETGVDYSPELGAAELIRRHGRDGAERMADRARIAYQTIVESEHPLLVRRVQELARDYGDDPNVVAIFAGLYDEIRSAPPSAKLMALLERREHRLAQGDAAAHARRAKAQQAEATEAAAAETDALGQIGAQHRRWQPRP